LWCCGTMVEVAGPLRRPPIRWTVERIGWQEPLRMRHRHRPLVTLLLIAGLSACSKPAPQAPVGGQGAAGAASATDPIGEDPTRPRTGAGDAMVRAFAAPSVAQNTDDPAGFVPLRSQEVKDAIYRALRSGETQRWQDGKLSGYAVPSGTTAANGCRAVRYTVDQRPEVPFESINACSVSR
jgi:hypothetical protein